MTASRTTHRHLEPYRYPLDYAIAVELYDPTVRWGMAQAAIPVFGFYGVLVAGAALVLGLHLPDVVFSVIAYAAIAALVLVAARPALQHGRSWAASFGWRAPRREDAGVIALWILMAFGSQLVIAVAMTDIVPSLRHQNTSNLDLHGLSIASIIITGVTSIIAAPLIEELTYRGLALRAVMRRYGFLPAAVSTSLLFGLSHAYEENTIAGAILIVLEMSAFGFLQCWLVRKTGRLGPGIVVHAVHNAIALTLAIVVVR